MATDDLDDLEQQIWTHRQAILDAKGDLAAVVHHAAMLGFLICRADMEADAERGRKVEAGYIKAGEAAATAAALNGTLRTRNRKISREVDMHLAIRKAEGREGANLTAVLSSMRAAHRLSLNGMRNAYRDGKRQESSKGA